MCAIFAGLLWRQKTSNQGEKHVFSVVRTMFSYCKNIVLRLRNHSFNILKTIVWHHECGFYSSKHLFSGFSWTSPTGYNFYLVQSLSNNGNVINKDKSWFWLHSVNEWIEWKPWKENILILHTSYSCQRVLIQHSVISAMAFTYHAWAIKFAKCLAAEKLICRFVQNRNCCAHHGGHQPSGNHPCAASGKHFN